MLGDGAPVERRGAGADCGEVTSRRRQRLAVVLAGACVALTAAVGTRAAVINVDNWVWRTSLNLKVDPLVNAARVVTTIFSPPVTVSVLLLVAAAASRRQASWRPLLWAGVAATAMAVGTQALKMWLGRPGPGSLAAEKLNGAYPSGHTASLVLCGGAVVLVLGLHALRTAWLSLAGLVLLVIGCLVYAHQHWLSDILGSLLLSGAILLWLAPRLAGPQRRRPRGAPQPADALADRDPLA